LAVLLTTLAFVSSVLVGCDKQSSAQDDEPAEWVKEANERSQKQREAKKNKKAELPDPTRPAHVAADKPKIERPMLWRIAGPKGPVYLFGTIHGGIPDLGWDAFPEEAHEAFNASTVVVLEADVDNVDPNEVGSLALLEEGKSLKEMLGEEHFKTLVDESSQPAMVLDLLQPWAAYAELSRIMVGEGRAVDAMIKVEAKVRDKKVLYLESVRQQLEILQAAVTAEMVRDLLADLDHQKAQLDKMVEAYKKGDIDALSALAFEPSEVEKHPKLYEELFTKRNRDWTSDVERYIEIGNIFVAVGAGHLGGDKSVIKMLEEKGHKVERVAADDGTPPKETKSEETAPEEKAAADAK
jgi:uncharacterized protein YbaP (TraB family)